MKKLMGWWKRWVHRGHNTSWPIDGMVRCLDHPWVQWPTTVAFEGLRRKGAR